MNWLAACFQAAMLVCGITLIVAVSAFIIVHVTGTSWIAALTAASAIFATIGIALFLIVIFMFHE